MNPRRDGGRPCLSRARRRRWCAVVGFALAGWAGAGEKSDAPAPGNASSSTPPPVLRVATLNLNYGNDSLKEKTELLRTCGADVIALQESNAESEAHFRRELKEPYPHIYFNQPKSRVDGFAFLSKMKLSNLQRFEPPKEGFFPSFSVEVEVEGRTVQILNLHLQAYCPQPGDGFREILKGLENMEAIHAAEMENLARHIKPGKPVIILGDLNSLPGMRAPVFLTRKGFTDSFASVNRQEPRTTTWKWNWRGIPLAFCFDYLFHGPEFETVESRVLPAEGSDHAMVLSALRWKRKEEPEKPK